MTREIRHVPVLADVVLDILLPKPGQVFVDCTLGLGGHARLLLERITPGGKLIGFDFEGIRFPLEPRTAFYDWLYINAIYPHREWLVRLNRYAGFTDIEFNPERSVNCQARSCALFVSLMSKGLLERAVESPQEFLAMLGEHRYRPQQVEREGQRALVSSYVAGERRTKR